MDVFNGQMNVFNGPLKTRSFKDCYAHTSTKQKGTEPKKKKKFQLILKKNRERKKESKKGRKELLNYQTGYLPIGRQEADVRTSAWINTVS